jgi:hypothetical protein
MCPLVVGDTSLFLEFRCLRSVKAITDIAFQCNHLVHCIGRKDRHHKNTLSCLTLHFQSRRYSSRHFHLIRYTPPSSGSRVSVRPHPSSISTTPVRRYITEAHFTRIFEGKHSSRRWKKMGPHNVEAVNVLRIEMDPPGFIYKLPSSCKSQNVDNSDVFKTAMEEVFNSHTEHILLRFYSSKKGIDNARLDRLRSTSIGC